jgi:hypothetical protein
VARNEDISRGLANALGFCNSVRKVSIGFI